MPQRSHSVRISRAMEGKLARRLLATRQVGAAEDERGAEDGRQLDRLVEHERAQPREQAGADEDLVAVGRDDVRRLAHRRARADVTR